MRVVQNTVVPDPEQEGQKFKAGLSYIASSRSVWATRNLVSNRKKEGKETEREGGKKKGERKTS